MAETETLDDLRAALLARALEHVPFQGWTDACLAVAARELDIDPATAKRAFPRGALDLVKAFHAAADQAMLAAVPAEALGQMRIRDRIAALVRARLAYLEPHREAVRRAIALQAMPVYAAPSLAAAARTVDLIWRAAGDTATDFNYYSKRLLLGGVYGSTMLYWLNDRSPGAEGTWRFLDRRIADVMKIQKARGRFDDQIERYSPVLNSVLRRFAQR